MTQVQDYLDTFRRIPRPIVLSMASREFVMGDPIACVCGWAIREDIFRKTGEERTPDIAERSTVAIIDDAARRFGGNFWEWHAVYFGVINSSALDIEEAFTLRVMEAAQ